MKIKMLGILAAFTFGNGVAYGADCGEAPHSLPFIPKGEAAAADDIRTARLAVVEYSNAVDKYLLCMDERATRILPYLTKEQKGRWEEDLAELHEQRRDVQTEMNLAIRNFRKAGRE